MYKLFAESIKLSEQDWDDIASLLSFFALVALVILACVAMWIIIFIRKRIYNKPSTKLIRINTVLSVIIALGLLAWNFHII